MNADNNNKIHNPWPLYIGEFFNNENNISRYEIVNNYISKNELHPLNLFVQNYKINYKKTMAFIKSC